MVTWSDASSTMRSQHFLYSSSYSSFFERFVQRIVIGLRTTEQVRRNKTQPTRKYWKQKKKLFSSVPLAEISKKNEKNRKHVLKRIFTSGLALSVLFAYRSVCNFKFKCSAVQTMKATESRQNKQRSKSREREYNGLEPANQQFPTLQFSTTLAKCNARRNTNRHTLYTFTSSQGHLW